MMSIRGDEERKGEGREGKIMTPGKRGMGYEEGKRERSGKIGEKRR